jgi:hypothetical protein
MANMQRQLQPIAQVAASFQKLNDDATADEIAAVATEGIEALAEVLEALEMSDRTAVRLITKWKKATGDLRSITTEQSTRIAKRLLDVNKGKPLPVSVETDEGVQVICTPKVTVRRSEVARDDLVKAVERAAGEPANRVSPTGTGEVLDYDTAKVLLFKKCFRFEPRWSDLKKLGVNDDEFCRKDFGYSLDIKEGMIL